MALAPKKNKVVETPKCSCDCKDKVETLLTIVSALTDRIEALEAKKVIGKATIQKVEEYNGESVPFQDEYSHGMRMNFEDKLISMKNAIAILPPNLLEDGKHSAANIGAICGFIVTDELYERLYEDAA